VVKIIDENQERLTNNRWLRALQLAKILFDDQGYFSCYLDQIEEFVKDNHLEINGPAVEFGIKNKEAIRVDRKHCESCLDCQTFTSEDAALLVIDTTTGRLSYNLDIGRTFPFHHMRVTVCTTKSQIICKIQRPIDKQTT